MIAKMRSHRKPNYKTLLVILVLLLIGATVITLAVARRSSSIYASPSYFVMDTTFQIKIEGRDTEDAKEDARVALDRAREIESHTSRFQDTSDIAELSRHAGVSPVEVHKDTFQVIKESLALTERLEGTFDITVAPVIESWGFYEKVDRIPDKEKLDTALELVDYRLINLDPDAHMIYLEKQGMSLDLGGAAKGYAVDEIISLLRSRGVKHALVNLGGTVGALGGRADGSPWIVGIQHPRKEGELLGRLELRDTFVSSTGDYERYFTKDEVRYCHLFDPHSGLQPRETVATSIVTENALQADIISTATFVLGPRRGMKKIESMPGVEGLIVTSDGRVLTSSSFKENCGSRLDKHI